ncbi:hypothetical protein [Pelagibius sp. Alg239-R121]|uniref:hypothetical protein n=1 Tax=Pelagibius sp. Alg239-R121 TaxID=2993448 RepID=UPI0024A6CFBD|nr:hypothetical protein [Pelagibius sp. Alg239-R121]
MTKINAATDCLTDNHINKRPIDMWVQEAVFGHRYIEEQKAFMLVLEVLSICRALQIDGSGTSYEANRIFSHPKSSENEHESFKVPVRKMGALRYILFQDSSLERINYAENLTPEERLEQWVEELNRGYKATARKDTVDFKYLSTRFGDRFFEVLQAVRILRGLELDVIHNRRWTSRFLVPRGPNLQFADVKEDFSADRRFFGRGGEMVYLMLNRSSQADELAALLKTQFFGTEDSLNKIAAELAPPKTPDSDASDGGVVGYLPLKHHSSYERMAGDWVSILNLSELPTPQKLDPLFRMTALNLVRYFVDRAHEVAESPVRDPIPLDLTGGAKSDLRDLSRSYLKRQRQLIEDAVENFIIQSLDGMPKWQQAHTHPDLEQRSNLAKQAIREAFNTNIYDSETGAKEPTAWRSDFLKAAKGRSRNNVSTLIEPLGKQTGFVLARRGVGSWFAGSDEFIEALVLANVTRPVTIMEFMSSLYERYSIVIGPREAGIAFDRPPCDISSFEDNLKAFERRLTGLGYVKRLSDDCAFVSNPYWLDDVI